MKPSNSEKRNKYQSEIHRPKRNIPGPEENVLLSYKRLGKSIDTRDIEREFATCPS